MRVQRILVAVFALVGIAAFPVAPGLSAQEGPTDADYRGTIMSGLRAHTGSMRALTRGISHPRHVLEHARAIRALSMMMADAFPEGSGGEETRAKDEIWSDWSGFMEKLTELQTAAAALLEAAEAGNQAAVAPAFQAVNRTCRGCHEPYRRPAN